MPTHRLSAPQITSALRRLAIACAITLLAFLLSAIMMSPLSASTSALFSVPERNDFTITDFYSMVADARAVSHLDTNIVVINIDRSDRQDIAEIIEIADLAGAKVIALDVMFDSPRDGDGPLLDVISRVPGLIQPLVMRKSAESPDTFSIAAASFFYHTDVDSSSVYAAASLPSIYHKSVVREMQLSFPTRGDGDIPSLAVAVAEATDPGAVQRLRQRGHRLEPINYHSRRFTVLEPDQLIANADLLRDRIVLIGAMSDPADLHPAPTNSSVPGVLIHAHSIATILDSAFMNAVPRGFNIFIAFLLCLAIVVINLFFISGVKGLVLRLLQVLLVWLTVQLGYWLFVTHSVIVDFSYALLMLTFGLFACDIWNGLAVIVRWSIAKLKRKPN